MRTKKVSFIINPRTGQNVTKLPDILAIFAAAGWKTTVQLKEYGKHVMNLASASADEKDDLVLAYGGDGTLNQVVNGMMSSKKRRGVVGVMPGGTANVWAGEIGVPVDPVKAALTLVNSEARKVDVGRAEIYSITFPGEEPTLIDGNIKKKASKESKSVRHHFLLMAGLGIDAAVMANVSKPLKYRIGALAVGVSAAKQMPSQRAFPIEVRSTGDNEDQVTWKGEALQVVIGNTRRYAKVASMTPDAYIDDGILDVCVITSGDSISTAQQLFSLLLRLKPDNATAEYFHGAHLLLTVPSDVLFQVDGSPVKLKDYLSKDDYAKLQQVEDKHQVLLTYQIDAVPHALEVAIPRTYNDELFEHTADQQHTDEGKSPVVVQPQGKDGEYPQTEKQEHTAKVESLSQTSVALKDKDEQEEQDKKELQHAQEMKTELPAFVNAVLENGRRVTVIGKTPDPERKETYIIAGSVQDQMTGEIAPVAVVVNGKTVVFNRDGQQVSSVNRAVQELREGSVIVVDGPKSKRSVVRAERLVC
jgi:YegS/Rv2252/BmrU family lipid kinase